MSASTYWGIGLIVYGLLCILVAVVKPNWAWQSGKLQGFIELIGENGTVIMLWVIAAATIGGGVFLIL